MQHPNSRGQIHTRFGDDRTIVNPYINNGGGLKYNHSGKVPCITATYHNGYDGFGTRPYILENGE